MDQVALTDGASLEIEVWDVGSDWIMAFFFPEYRHTINVSAQQGY